MKTPRFIFTLVMVALLLMGASDASDVIKASAVRADILRGEPVDYDDVIVEGDLDLRGMELGLVYFNNATFQGSVNFNCVNFTKGTWFNNATFGGAVNFVGARFSGGDANFFMANFSGGDSHFDMVQFSEAAIFQEADFSGGNVSFKEAQFGGVADFKKAEFSGGAADFKKAEFSSGDADFEGAVFGGAANFDGAEFSGGAAIFSGAEFNSTADFKNVKFSSAADFVNAEFGGDALFRDAYFCSGVASFRNAKFSGGIAEFKKAKFIGGAAYFDGAEFSGRQADFGSAVFGGDVSFQRVYFRSNGDTNFRATHFYGTADFKEAQFNRTAIFEEAQFSGGDASFANANFSGSAKFFDANFSGDADFNRAKFSGLADFEKAEFSNYAFFENAGFSKTCGQICLNRTEYGKICIRWDDIKDIYKLNLDSEAYLKLINNYKTLGWFDDYNECYFYFMKTMDCRRCIGFRWLVGKILYISYGYGAKPEFPLVWSLATIILFGVIWWGAEPRLKNGKSVTTWKGALKFSSMVFLSATKLSIEPPDLEVRENSWDKSFFLAERVIGSLLFFFFLFAASTSLLIKIV